MVYIASIGISAFLIFFIQPLMGRIILPYFGGGASVWLASLIFYQFFLLIGYALGHAGIRFFNKSTHLLIQLFLLLFSLSLVPPALHNSADITRRLYFPSHPFLSIFILLAMTIGVPYLLLSTTSPTLQFWLAHDRNMKHLNPYVQYAVSNAGSLSGLLAYPFFVERYFSNSQQVAIWSIGYFLFAGLMGLSILRFAFFGLRDSYARQACKANSVNEATLKSTSDSPDSHRRVTWLLLSLIPSAALLVVTHHLTLDVVNVPLLWVLPLVLYLLSFIFCFAFPAISRPSRTRTLLCFLPVATLFAVRRFGPGVVPFWVDLCVASVALFALCMYFHGNLERSKPAPRFLTEFYLLLSLGGSLGSIMAGIAAPLLFRSTYEFNVVIIVSLGLMLWPLVSKGSLILKTVSIGLLVFLLFITALIEETSYLDFVRYRARSFYGTYVVQSQPAIEGKKVAARFLRMGTTIHGGQARDEQGRLMPITYFHEKSGVGRVLQLLPGAGKIGVVGLGTGLIALYGHPGEQIDFYEIDPLVEHIARTQFDNLASSAAEIKIIIGDARLSLRRVAPHYYDILILDAFTSGAIPTHLLTVEAMSEFLGILKPQGVILYHISNRHVRLWPVLSATARALHLFTARHEAIPEPRYYKTVAQWAVLTKNRRLFKEIMATDENWSQNCEKPVLWTDDFYDIWSQLDLFH